MKEVEFNCYECDADIMEWESRGVYTDNDEVICVDCRDDASYDNRVCDDCGEVYSCSSYLQDTYEIGYVCDDCVDSGDYGIAKDSYGDDCLVHVDNIIYIHGEPRTDDVDHFNCEECGDVFHEHEDAGDPFVWRCQPCDDLINSGHELIREYNDNPPIEFFGECHTGAGRYAGVELEIDYGDVCGFAEEVNEEMDSRIFLMEDSSLSNDGVEIITQPLSYDEHMNTGLWDWVTREADNYGFDGEADSCGIHVHISRDSLWNSNTIDNLLFLVNRYWTKIVEFSRRDYCDLERWADKHVKDKPERDVKIDDIKNGEWGRNRYSAINLRNHHTIEFRMFKGSLKQAEILGAIQFAYLFVDIADTYAYMEDNIEDVMWNEIMDFAKEHYYIAYMEFERLGVGFEV